LENINAPANIPNESIPVLLRDLAQLFGRIGCSNIKQTMIKTDTHLNLFRLFIFPPKGFFGLHFRKTICFYFIIKHFFYSFFYSLNKKPDCLILTFPSVFGSPAVFSLKTRGFARLLFSRFALSVTILIYHSLTGFSRAFSGYFGNAFFYFIILNSCLPDGQQE